MPKYASGRTWPDTPHFKWQGLADPGLDHISKRLQARCLSSTASSEQAVPYSIMYYIVKVGGIHHDHDVGSGTVSPLEACLS